MHDAHLHQIVEDRHDVAVAVQADRHTPAADMADHPAGIGLDQVAPHLRPEEHGLVAAPVVGHLHDIGAGVDAAIGQTAQPVGETVEPGPHQVRVAPQVGPTLLDAQKGAGAFDDAPKVGDNRPAVALLLHGLGNAQAGKVGVPGVIGDPLATSRVFQSQTCQLLDVEFLSKLVGIGCPAEEDVDAKLIKELLTSAILSLEFLDELPLVQPTIQGSAIHRRAAAGRQYSLF